MPESIASPIRTSVFGDWTELELTFLREHYPTNGRVWCAEKLGRTVDAIRTRTSRLGLHFDYKSATWKESRARAAATVTGRKRPAQSDVMRKLWKEGKLGTAVQRKNAAEKMRARNLSVPHPRGMKGKTFSRDTLERMSASSSATWKSRTEAERDELVMRMHIARVAKYGCGAPKIRRGSWLAGWREIGGKRIYARSRWEANYARYLEWLRARGNLKSWEHEPKTFWFEGIRRGVVSYLPDFEVVTNSGKTEYHEVKGWMDAKSVTKIKRMAFHFPDVRLIVIAAKQYREIGKKVGRIIEGWE